MPSPDQNATLLNVRVTKTSSLIEAYRARRPGRTVEEEMEDRWLALSILGELLRRGKIEQL